MSLFVLSVYLHPAILKWWRLLVKENIKKKLLNCFIFYEEGLGIFGGFRFEGFSPGLCTGLNSFGDSGPPCPCPCHNPCPGPCFLPYPPPCPGPGPGPDPTCPPPHYHDSNNNHNKDHNSGKIWDLFFFLNFIKLNLVLLLLSTHSRGWVVYIWHTVSYRTRCSPITFLKIQRSYFPPKIFFQCAILDLVNRAFQLCLTICNFGRVFGGHWH